MAAEIQKQRTVNTVLVKGSGGEFEVSLDGSLIFSKRQEGRFPVLEELLAKMPA
jgi:selT/selW/selH-like putative selenoprotein